MVPTIDKNILMVELPHSPSIKMKIFPEVYCVKIIRDDLGLEPDQFIKLYRQLK